MGKSPIARHGSANIPNIPRIRAHINDEFLPNRTYPIQYESDNVTKMATIAVTCALDQCTDSRPTTEVTAISPASIPPCIRPVAAMVNRSTERARIARKRRPIICHAITLFPNNRSRTINSTGVAGWSHAPPHASDRDHAHHTYLQSSFQNPKLSDSWNVAKLSRIRASASSPQVFVCTSMIE